MALAEGTHAGGQTLGPLSASRPPPPSHRGARGSFYLGAGHSDLWACIDVDAAVGLSGDGAAHSVGDTHSQGPAVLTVA